MADREDSAKARRYVYIDVAEFELLREQVKGMRLQLADFQRYKEVAEERRVAQERKISDLCERADRIDEMLEAYSKSLDGVATP